MINDLATYRLDPARTLRSTGDLRTDLISWAREILEHYRDPVHVVAPIIYRVIFLPWTLTDSTAETSSMIFSAQGRSAERAR